MILHAVFWGQLDLAFRLGCASSRAAETSIAVISDLDPKTIT